MVATFPRPLQVHSRYALVPSNPLCMESPHPCPLGDMTRSSSGVIYWDRKCIASLAAAVFASLVEGLPFPTDSPLCPECKWEAQRFENWSPFTALHRNGGHTQPPSGFMSDIRAASALAICSNSPTIIFKRGANRE